MPPSARFWAEATLADEEALVEWLCKEVVAEQRQEEVLIASFSTLCKEQHIDPPTPDRVCCLVHTAIYRFDEWLCATIMQQLSAICFKEIRLPVN